MQNILMINSKFIQNIVEDKSPLYIEKVNDVKMNYTIFISNIVKGEYGQGGGLTIQYSGIKMYGIVMDGNMALYKSTVIKAFSLTSFELYDSVFRKHTHNVPGIVKTKLIGFNGMKFESCRKTIIKRTNITDNTIYDGGSK